MDRKVSFWAKVIIIAIFCGVVAANACSACTRRRLVDNYENFVNTFVEVGVKAKTGDQAAVAQMTELVDEMKQWEQRLEAEADGFTQEQAAKLAELREKAAKVSSAE
jgi:hypothetical protein